MSHEIDRILDAVARSPWFIDPAKGHEVMAILALRAERGPRPEPMFPNRPEALGETAPQSGGIQVLQLHGVMVPRAGMMGDVSSAVSTSQFLARFRQAAADPNVSALVLDVDSPGGQVDFVPELAAAVRGARREGRPIIAVANTSAMSAAYWVASQADELVATPSAQVGSIGVMMRHMDQSARAEREGVRVTYISAGPRKVEGNPFSPLGDEARAALEARVAETYAMFVGDVARARGVPPSVVRADPEKAERHFGGGRSYGAATALSLGMIDRIATLDDVIRGLGAKRRPRAENARRRLAVS